MDGRDCYFYQFNLNLEKKFFDYLLYKSNKYYKPIFDIEAELSTVFYSLKEVKDKNEIKIAYSNAPIAINIFDENDIIFLFDVFKYWTNEEKIDDPMIQENIVIELSENEDFSEVSFSNITIKKVQKRKNIINIICGYSDLFFLPNNNEI